MRVLLTYFFIIFLTMNLFSQVMTVTYRGPENIYDNRYKYPYELINAALDITKTEYGDYNLILSKRMNALRARTPSFIKDIDNFIFEASVNDTIENKLLSIKIPTTKGLYGYRIFLIDKKNQRYFSELNNLEKLKEKSIGQGSTWGDVKILEDQGFNVIKVLKYESLFKMLSLGRFDAFPRGVNEVFHEYYEMKDLYSNLMVEQDICLYYPLPKFFYTHKNNILLHDRISKGLEMILDNGTFDSIWSKYHEKYLLEANLKHRKIFIIENKFISNIVPLNDPKYWYVP